MKPVLWTLLVVAGLSGFTWVAYNWNRPHRIYEALLDQPCDSEPFQSFVRSSQRDSSLVVSWQDLDKNEVHDCQRLIVSTAQRRTLGPLVGIFVSRENVRSGDLAQGIVVGEIINYSGTEYPPLGIKQGVSCLSLREGESGLEARIWRPIFRTTCAQYKFWQTGFLSDTKFPVRRSRHAAHHLPSMDTLYPSTVRWMWDTNAGQYIGFRCRDAWCEIGRNLPPQVTWSDPYQVPGWSDEQILSQRQSGESLRLTNLVGRIEPLAHRTGRDRSGILSVALIRIRAMSTDLTALTAYADRLDLDAVPGQQGELRGVLRYRTQRELFSGALPYVPRGVTGASGTWDTVIYKEHLRHAPVGAVRWAWSDLDETAWFPCEAGCCRTDNCLTNSCT